eukprot:jgi/Bigna1/139862/aug1.52_g14570
MIQSEYNCSIKYLPEARRRRRRRRNTNQKEEDEECRYKCSIDSGKDIEVGFRSSMDHKDSEERNQPSEEKSPSQGEKVATSIKDDDTEGNEVPGEQKQRSSDQQPIDAIIKKQKKITENTQQAFKKGLTVVKEIDSEHKILERATDILKEGARKVGEVVNPTEEIETKELAKASKKVKKWIQKNDQLNKVVKAVSDGTNAVATAFEEKLLVSEEGKEFMDKSRQIAKAGKKILEQNAEKLLRAEKKHKVLKTAKNFVQDGLLQVEEFIGDKNKRRISNAIDAGKQALFEVSHELNLDQVVNKAKDQGIDTVDAAKDFMGTMGKFLEGKDDAGLKDLQNARSKLMDKLNNIGQEGFKRIQQGSALRNVLLERLDNVKKSVQDTLSREIQEGAVDALKIATDNNMSTRGLPWSVSSVNHLLFCGGISSTVYIGSSDAKVFPINSANPCSFQLNAYAGARIAMDSVFVICSAILDMRLNAWYELNNGWEATPQTAQRLLWKETVVNNFGISALSTGKATLLYYDLEYESCLNLFTSSIVAPGVAALNIAGIVLSFQWYCDECDKDSLFNYILLLAAVYTVFHFMMKHFVLRESLATTITKNREMRRRERMRLRARIDDLQAQILRKKSALKDLHRLDVNEIKARQAINNVIGLTDKIFRTDAYGNEKKGGGDQKGVYQPLSQHEAKHELKSAATNRKGENSGIEALHTVDK